MKKRILPIAGLALALLLVGVACAQSPTATPAAGNPVVLPGGGVPSAGGQVAPGREVGSVVYAYPSNQQTGLWVSGLGTVKVVPDVALLTLGVEARAISVAEAMSQASKAMDAIMAVLKSNGVADKDIQTQNFSIQPEYRWDEYSKKQVLTGYRVDNTVLAKLRELGKVGSIIDAAAKAGGDLTRIQGISFTVDDPTPYYVQAREKAVKDAIAKAQQMASLSGVTLGKPYYITESSAYVPPPVPRMTFEGKALGAPETPISPGETEISLSVQMAFSLQ